MMRELSVFHRVSARTHRYITLGCGLMFFLYMLNVVGDIVGRYLFLSPIAGTVEIGENVLAIALFMTMAGVELNGQNIRVGIVPEHFSRDAQARFEIVNVIFCLLFMAVLTWQNLGFAVRSYSINETAITLPIPLYIGKFAFFVGGMLLCIQFAFELVCQIYERLTGTMPVDKEVKS